MTFFRQVHRLQHINKSVPRGMLSFSHLSSLNSWTCSSISTSTLQFTNNGVSCKSSSSSSSSSLPIVYGAKARTFSNTAVCTFSSSNKDRPQNPEEILSNFANLDHRRASRTGFPEAVFGQGKTPLQIHKILDSMAENVNHLITEKNGPDGTSIDGVSTAILATRIDRNVYDEVVQLGPLQHGVMEYHETARILSVRANALSEHSIPPPTNDDSPNPTVIVACAGTTDLPTAEEAFLTLTHSHIPTRRIYDVGVAGLHRILSHLPTLRHPDVRAVIVCAGMDGALPSVVGGLVDVPVIAVPTSVGYGMSMGGVSAMLTMLNSCSPGVGVVNIDNGFGGAVLAMKMLRSGGKK